MTDMELAEEIGGLIFDAIKHGDEKHQAWLHDKSHELAPQIIAALRRGPERIDAKMAELLVDTTWRKAVGQCVADVCGLDGKPLGKRCDRRFISRERFDEHIAPLIRQCEHPPSGEMMMVLKSFAENRCHACGWPLSGKMEIGCMPFNCSYRPSEQSEEHNNWLKRAHEMERVRAMIAAAEAEGRKG